METHCIWTPSRTLILRYESTMEAHDNSFRPCASMPHESIAIVCTLVWKHAPFHYVHMEWITAKSQQHVSCFRPFSHAALLVSWYHSTTTLVCSQVHQMQQLYQHVADQSQRPKDYWLALNHHENHQQSIYIGCFPHNPYNPYICLYLAPSCWWQVQSSWKYRLYILTNFWVTYVPRTTWTKTIP